MWIALQRKPCVCSSLYCQWCSVLPLSRTRHPQILVVMIVSGGRSHPHRIPVPGVDSATLVHKRSTIFLMLPRMPFDTALRRGSVCSNSSVSICAANTSKSVIALEFDYLTRTELWVHSSSALMPAYNILCLRAYVAISIMFR